MIQGETHMIEMNEEQRRVYEKAHERYKKARAMIKPGYKLFVYDEPKKQPLFPLHIIRRTYILIIFIFAMVDWFTWLYIWKPETLPPTSIYCKHRQEWRP